MTTAVPYAWLKQLPRSALESHEDMPFGFPPPFPWEQFNAIFAKVFQIEHLKMEPGEWRLRESNELFTGLGARPVALNCDIAPLEGIFSWVMSDNDRDQLMSLLLTRKTDGELIDAEYKQAFYQFLCLELFSICNKLDFQKGLTPHLLESTELPHAASYCQDIILTYEERTYLVRLIVEERLRTSWRERFAERKLAVELPQSLTEKISIPLHLEAGSTAMRLKEWQQASAGDCMLLDRCTLKIGEDKGQIMISLDGKPLFLAQIKDGNVKILDYPLYHEASTTMVNDEDDDLDEFDIDTENHDTFSEDETEHTELTEHTEHSEHTDISEMTIQEKSTIGDKQPRPAAKAPAAQPASAQKPFNALELPVNVVVEVGRLEISIQKLIELKPGTILELNVHPEDGVDLTINGKIVGKGELMKIGDALGVRILDKGA